MTNEIDLTNLKERIDLPAPPRELANIFDTVPDHDSWIGIGVVNAENLVRLGALKRGEALLDIGCGIGRLAIALSPEFHGPGSRYEGVDPIARAIKWANENIAAKHAWFNFTHIDVFNAGYNRDGAEEEASFRLPFDDATFDVVALFSVFTHITTGGVLRYLDEIARVLKPEGRLFTSFFLIDDYARSAIAAGNVGHRELHAFRPSDETHWTSRPDIPEVAVAYPLDFVSSELEMRGFRQPTVHFGQWCKRPTDMKNRQSQDVLVSYKR